MKTILIKKIISELSPDYRNLDKLEDVMNEWIGEPEFEFVGVGDDDMGTVRIIVKEDNLYSLYRFFSIGERWVVSADEQNKPVDNVLVSLIENLD